MPNWTEQQKEAIEARGENILVSAAAGSGKTAVLSARVGEFIQNGGRLERLLIVTFTRPAAAEMRSRIARELNRRAAAEPENLHLQRQRLQLYKAKISTIDSFGIDLLRRNFQKADLSPDFTVMDETEAEVIRESALQRLIEDCYRDFPQGFGDALDMFGGETDSEALKKTVKAIDRDLDTMPFAEEWLTEQIERLEDPERWTAEACRLYLPIFEEYRGIYKEVLEDGLYEKDGGMREEAAFLDRVCTAFAAGDWDTGRNEIAQFTFGKKPTVKGKPPEDLRFAEHRRQLKILLNKGGKSYLSKGEIFQISGKQCREELRECAAGTRFLFEAVRRIRKDVRDEMHRRSGYSFSALADLALRLTVTDYSHRTGTFRVTALAEQEREAYDEILIDEYQDVNDLQDLFFRSITKNNCFAVGDIKQSIYGFRGANADNFLRKKQESRVVTLNRNFRSRAGILDYVNFLFRGLFLPQAGGISYTEEEALYPGRNDGGCRPLSDHRNRFLQEIWAPPGEEGGSAPEQDPETAAELFLIPVKSSADRTRTDREREEAEAAQPRLCARLIRDAIDGGATVYDKNIGAERPMRYSDIAVLLRNAGRRDAYEAEFQAAGIPLMSGGKGNFLETVECRNLTAFLQAVNNPWDSAALFAALTGSVFSFSAEQMAQIRICAPNEPLYTALKQYAEADPEGKRAVERLNRFRILAENLPAEKLIWEVYTATDFLALESAYPGARQNLMKFYAFARRYNRRDGLAGFLDFAEKARLTGKQEEASPAPEGDFVRLMTVHSSKGLEFAWCLVPELAAEFNKKDLSRPVYLDREFGIATEIRNKEQTAHYTTLPREVLKMRMKNRVTAEELRILYVALTRARDRLTLIGLCRNTAEGLEEFGMNSRAGTVLLPSLLDAGNALNWILTRTVLHPRAALLHTAYAPAETGETLPLTVIFSSVPEQKAERREETAYRCGLSKAELKRRFSYRYDRHLSEVPVMVYVTEIAKAREVPEGPLLIEEPPLRRPRFLENEELTGAEAGTAMHRFCQYADFTKDPAEEIRRLTEEGHLTREQAETIHLPQIETLRRSELMKTVLSCPSFEREVRFVCRIPVSYYTGNPGEEGEMLMQGAIDLLCRTETGYLIVDFKSDRCGEAELLARYSRQLNLYAAAVRRLYDLPVAGRKIWSFRLGKSIDVPEGEL